MNNNNTNKSTIIWTRLSSDINGNPRYVCFFSHLNTPEEKHNPNAYTLAVTRANKIGGRKYNTKKFGGGIVFQAYSIKELEADIENILKETA